ncbi:MAG: cyclic nucleotide-binding domain-containing protein [Deltaproteobacteria bacterium]|nr:MAG: cyclic nucleotide-binding domain-containing protein [Deltaproteobacteria bacterium]
MFIQKSMLFRWMDQEVLKEIDKIMDKQSCAEGTVLFERGESANNLYILREGSIELTIGDNGHVTHVIKTPGEAFGWSSLVNHHVYTASAVCSSPTELIRIPSEKLNMILESNPASGLIFFRRLAEIISKRVATSYNLLLRSHERTSRYLRSVGSL